MGGKKMHYAKAKDGSYPALGKKKPEEVKVDLNKVNEEKLEAAKQEIVDRNPHIDLKAGKPLSTETKPKEEKKKK